MRSSKKPILKSMTLLFFMVMTLLVLAACGGGGSATTGGNSEGEEVQEEKVYKLRMNSQNAPPTDKESSSYIAQEGFKKMVEERTNGRVEVELYYANQLAGQSESLDALSRGTIDMQVITPVAWADKIPESNWSSIPFGWKTEEDLHYLLRESGLGDLYEEALNEYGIKPLFYYHSSLAGYFSNVRIAEPADMKGVVMNTQGTLKGDFYKKMGAGIANIPFSDYYEGLLRGTVDAVSFPTYAVETYKLGEVAKYLIVPGEVSPAMGLITINQEKWNQLPSDLQDIIMEVSMEIEQQSMVASKKLTDKGINYAKENGVEVVELSDEARKEFVDIAKETYWKAFGETNDRTKKMVEILEANSEK
ncbi:TRAP transporter substrate-binding protein [Bacillus dakarensis]|uniref:TRAP transporter substrate-binding protein n=1 Tax=Robertmurraya dakarensis TaxID=1926278 RepID=UPI00098137CF|nr:TRAP transporter substrate-binding protein [Bacillus dakarensis]